MDNIANGPQLARVNKHGPSLCIVLTKAIRVALPWRHRDVIAVRLVGEKLILERVAVESMARIRTGEPVAHETGVHG